MDAVEVEDHRRQPCAVFVASETALVRRHVANVLVEHAAVDDGDGRNNVRLEVDFSAYPGHAHPIDLHNNQKVLGAGAEHYKRLREMSRDATADLCAPFLEWWGLAHARKILVRRGEDLRAASSTYSGEGTYTADR